MKLLRAFIISGFMTLGLAHVCLAAEKFNLDKAETTIRFAVSYFILTSVSGHFNDFTGSFVIDRDDPENSSVDMVIQTDSVDTGFAARDSEIRGPGLFNAALYPEMHFHSHIFEIGPEDNAGHIIGELSLHGVTKPMVLDLHQVAGKHNSDTVGFVVTGQIKRSDFGMDGFMIPVGDIVTLLVCYNVQDCKARDTISEVNRPLYNP
ncbi:MAG: polyisoprenoid-binding protein [Alphaproteobacteria bacterium]|nr:polyisoprenoid-binding protein [Alphaproteobacteria bacterium]